MTQVTTMMTMILKISLVLIQSVREKHMAEAGEEAGVRKAALMDKTISKKPTMGLAPVLA